MDLIFAGVDEVVCSEQKLIENKVEQMSFLLGEGRYLKSLETCSVE